MLKCANSLKSLKTANGKRSQLHKQRFQIIFPAAEMTVELWEQSAFQLINRIILATYTEESKTNIISVLELCKYF
jgi:hypothetical protein